MTLNIENDEADQLAQELVRETGEPLIQIVIAAMREKLERIKNKRNADRTFQKLEAIRLRVAKMPVFDNRTPDEILGYDENGLPT